MLSAEIQSLRISSNKMPSSTTSESANWTLFNDAETCTSSWTIWMTRDALCHLMTCPSSRANMFSRPPSTSSKLIITGIFSNVYMVIMVSSSMIQGSQEKMSWDKPFTMLTWPKEREMKSVLILFKLILKKMI